MILRMTVGSAARDNSFCAIQTKLVIAGGRETSPFGFRPSLRGERPPEAAEGGESRALTPSVTRFARDTCPVNGEGKDSVDAAEFVSGDASGRRGR